MSYLYQSINTSKESFLLSQCLSVTAIRILMHNSRTLGDTLLSYDLILMHIMVMGVANLIGLEDTSGAHLQVSVVFLVLARTLVINISEFPGTGNLNYQNASNQPKHFSPVCKESNRLKRAINIGKW